MAIELIVILAMLIMFASSIILNLNMGVAAFVTAFVVGVYIVGVPIKALFNGFPANMFINLLGITFLLGIAHENKTMDWLISRCIALTHGKIALLPWVFFAVSAITATLGPAVAPLMIGLALNLAGRYKINPLLAGAMVVHGTQGGSFSPIAPFGVLINQLVESNGLQATPYTLYFLVLASHIILAGVIFFLFGGRHLIGKHADDLDTLTDQEKARTQHLDIAQVATLLGIVCLVIAVLILHMHIGMTALSIALILLLFIPRNDRQKTLMKMPWGVIITISGVLTYVSVMQDANAITWLGDHLNSFGSPLMIALMMCYLAAIVTAFASTFGTIGMLIPLSTPLLLTGDIHVGGMMSAMVVSAVMTDISPFSTYGALVLASAREEIREKLFKKMLTYVGVLTLIIPLITWVLFIVPAW